MFRRESRRAPSFERDDDTPGFTHARKKQLSGPPDGGYGWVVLASASMCLFMVVSVGRINGLVFVEIIDRYNVTRTEASGVLMVARLFTFTTAPLVSRLLVSFNYSFVLCTGGFLISLGLMLTSLTTQYWQLIITYGILLGCGSNFIIGASTLVVGVYFKKRRSLALGILWSAASTAGFALPVLFTVLLEEYQLHGSLLIVSGITLHACAFGMLVRQPTWVDRKPEPAEKELEILNPEKQNGENRPVLILQTPAIRKLKQGALCNKESPVMDNEGPVDKPHNGTQWMDTVSEKASVCETNGATKDEETKEAKEPLIQRKYSADTKDTDELGSPSNGHVPFKNDSATRTKHPLDIKLGNHTEKKPKHFFSSTLRSIRHSMRIFTDGLFVLQLINRALIIGMVLNFLPILPDYVERDLSTPITKREVSFVLAMTAVGDILLRFIIGVCLTKIPFQTKHVFAVLSVATGINIFCFSFSNSYTALLIGSVMFGLLTGAVIVVQYVLEVDLMGLKRARTAQAISQFFVGIVGVTFGLTIGYVRDSLGSYDLCLKIMGGVTTVSGLVWIFEPCVVRCLPPPPKDSESKQDVSQQLTEPHTPIV